MAILFVAIIALCLLFFISSRFKNGGGGDWIQFFAKGKEAGFSLKETEILRQLTVQCNFEYPLSIFTSLSQLDKCLYAFMQDVKEVGEGEDTRNFLSKLYGFRTKIEINKPAHTVSIADSRNISEGQTLRVLLVGIGVFKSHVVKNTGQYLTISRPVSKKKNSASIRWEGEKIAVYFWREEDAGYVFDAEVLDEVFSMGVSSLKITHGSSLFRTQKRKSLRTKIHKAAFLYLVPNNEPPHKLEMEPGFKCFLEDISDTGCAVVVGGKADAGLRVKVQFALNNTAVCMTGTVRSVRFHDDINRSTLHIEAETMPLEMRIHILGEIFGLQTEEDEDELPFRISDGEMEGLLVPEDVLDTELSEYTDKPLRESGDEL